MLHHIELYVSDLKKTRAFYDELLPLLDYKLYQEWAEGFSYQSPDGVYIVFVQVPEQYASYGYHRRHIGLNHLAFRVETRKQVDQLRKRLQQRGVTFLYDERYPYAGGPGHYAVFFEDVDRIKLEVVANSC